ncbi:hypothetical protein EMGBS15_02730 [Filimonas sp.]|nr:hypothetical protein EMGBS15_02730 [Filimonas sp.]
MGSSSTTIFNGVIYKTLDRGQNWTIFDTGLPEYLARIEFINDSIALISGTNGMLLKWNKNSFATEVLYIKEQRNMITIYPNPANEEITIESTKEFSTVEIYSVLSKLVYKSKVNHSTQLKINTKELSAGIYSVKIDGKYFKKFVIE